MGTSEEIKEDWMNAKWRPMMGWMYMLVCTCDFVIFPILWSLLQTMNHGQVTSQWNPLTLQGAGLFHMAMGAIMGIAAFGRTQEKLAGKANDNGAVQTPTTGFPSGSPTPSVSPAGFAAPTNSFGTQVTAAPVPKPISSTSFNTGLDPSDPPFRNTRND